MTSSITSASDPVVDLLSPHEEEILVALISFIDNRTALAKENLVTVLSRVMTVSYFVGADRAAKEIGEARPLGVGGLDPIIKRLGTHLDKTFKGLSRELTDIIKSGIKKGQGYDTVKKALEEKITAGWGKDITFNSVGQIRKTVRVNPDGTMKWVKNEITQPITLPADTYSKTLARTTMKQAYAQGHFSRYEQAGYRGWVYVSVADERTRPHHLALHGRVFLFGTDEEAMARKVMEEYNCRCRPKAWFDNTQRDTPAETYHEQRAAWAKQALGELPDDQKDGDQAKFLHGIVKHSTVPAAAA